MGVTTRILWPFPLRIISARNMPASTVLPRPTPSAMQILGLGNLSAFNVGTYWKFAPLIAARFATSIESEKRDEFLKSLGLNVFHFQDIDVKKNLSEIVETIKKWIEENTPSALQTPLLKKGELNPKYKCLPIDTKYFKDLELEILGLFDDLDKSLDGWLIKSENYQALNTILPKFKEKVQTIYIDPPFNLDSSDQFLYRTNYKDANWATLLENRLRIAKDWMNERGSIFIRCDYNGNWIVRCLMDEIFGRENFRNEIVSVSYTHLRAHETPEHLVCRLLLEKKKKKISKTLQHQRIRNYE